VMMSDFNTYQDVGTPVQDILNTINPSALGAAHGAYYNKQAFDLYLLHIPTGTNTTPDTVLVYNLRTKRWSVWQPTDLIASSLFNIDVNGNTQWLFAASAGPLYFWDSTVLRDRNGNAPISYAVTARSSWLDFGDATLRKALNAFFYTGGDNNLTLTVEAAITDNDLDNNPATVLPATGVTTSLLQDLFIPLAVTSSQHRWYRLTFTSPASTVQDVLDAYSLEISPLFRY